MRATLLTITLALTVATPSAAASQLQQEQRWIASQGKVVTLPPELAGHLGLTNGSKGYVVKGIQWDDDNDQSAHILEMSENGEPYMVMAYAPANGTYAINWLTDVNGKLYRTTYGSKPAGQHIVPNEKYAAQFAAELAYWGSITSANFHATPTP